MSGFTYKTGVLGILIAVYALTGSLYAQDQGDSDGSSTNETAAEQASSEDPRAARMREINQAWIERIHEDGQA
ncbi:MAG: hypothetical protein KDK27_07955, partial [Leptospiraceae bacterium]|nr:hypothetical protein [Leptospiraceae bacterium]